MTLPNLIAGDLGYRQAKPGQRHIGAPISAQGIGVRDHPAPRVAPRAGRADLPHDTPAKAVGVDCGARFLKTDLVVDPISHGWH